MSAARVATIEPRLIRRALRALRVSVRVVVAVAVLTAGMVWMPRTAYASGPGAIMTPAGYNVTLVPRGDDTSNVVVNLPFTMNWNGTLFTQIYINMNGNVTFGSAYSAYNPSTTLAGTNRNIMAPFWADVDTRNTAAAQVTHSSTTPGSIPQVNGRNAFLVNWIGVARYDNQSTPTNSFQLVLVDRSDTGSGNFDFIFNYDQVTWDIATAQSTTRARVGWGFSGTGFELPGSGTAAASPSSLLDGSDQSTSLVRNTLNAGGQLGRYVFQVRSGQAPNVPPQLSVPDRVLEGNAPNSHAGHLGVGDATAFDPDGSIASLTHNRPEPLPLGVTNVTWTATDNRGATVTAVQRITVVDTTAPSNPILSSPSHTTGTWTRDDVVTAEAVGGADVCSGIRGYSYSWSLGTPQAPDTTPDPTTFNPGAPPTPVVVHEETFPTATWPSGWTRVRLAGGGEATTHVRSQSVRSRSGHAAEVWADTGTRRTFGFWRSFDLSAFESASLTYHDNTVELDGGSDFSRVEVSTNGGATWTTLRTTGANAGWTQRSFPLPVGGTVVVRFSASLNTTSEFSNWDDINITGITPAVAAWYSASDTAALADGTWYFNLRTGDIAGNWSAPVALGPFLIDRVAPVTTDDVPAGWRAGPVTVTLSVGDAGHVSATRFSFDGGVWHEYTGPISISAQGAIPLHYYSRDAAGNVEVQRTATIRIDSVAPTAPSPVSASATSTQSAQVNWSAATDAGSGVVGYRVYRDGVQVATISGLTFADVGLVPGQTYEYQVAAFDAAGNETRSVPVRVTPPAATLWLTVTDTSVEMAVADPDLPVIVTLATTVRVGGVGEITYDLFCSASDFVNTVAGSPTPSMPASVLSFITRGWVTRPKANFSESPQFVNSSTGSSGLWSHEYVFDYVLTVPIDYEPGTYQSVVTYSLVQR